MYKAPQYHPNKTNMDTTYPKTKADMDLLITMVQEDKDKMDTNFIDIWGTDQLKKRKRQEKEVGTKGVERAQKFMRDMREWRRENNMRYETREERRLDTLAK